MAGATGERPAPLVFLTGKGRSGVTLVGRVLARHPAVALLSELHFFEGLWDPASGAAPLGRDAALRLAEELIGRQRALGVLFDIEAGTFAEEAAGLVDGVPPGERTAPALFRRFLEAEAARQGKAVACEQTPRHVFFIPSILSLYPDARVVVVVRDPRDVLAAQKGKWRMPRIADRAQPARERLRVRANYHPVSITLLWRASVRAGSAAAADPRVREVRFEDLVASPEAVVRELCAFLGLDYEPGMLDVPHVGPGYVRSGRTGLEPGEAGRWREILTPREVAACQAVAGRAMTARGYAPVPVRGGRGRAALAAATFPAAAVAAALLNRRRYPGLARAIGRRVRAPSAPA